MGMEGGEKLSLQIETGSLGGGETLIANQTLVHGPSLDPQSQQT
jgi:hypothetical protein